MSVDTWITTITELSEPKSINKTSLTEIESLLEKLLYTEGGIEALKKQTVPAIQWRRPVIQSLVHLIEKNPGNTPAMELLPGIIRGEQANSPNRWRALSIYLGREEIGALSLFKDIVTGLQEADHYARYAVKDFSPDAGLPYLIQLLDDAEMDRIRLRELLRFAIEACQNKSSLDDSTLKALISHAKTHQQKGRTPEGIEGELIDLLHQFQPALPPSPSQVLEENCPSPVVDPDPPPTSTTIQPPSVQPSSVQPSCVPSSDAFSRAFAALSTLEAEHRRMQKEIETLKLALEGERQQRSRLESLLNAIDQHKSAITQERDQAIGQLESLRAEMESAKERMEQNIRIAQTDAADTLVLFKDQLSKDLWLLFTEIKDPSFSPRGEAQVKFITERFRDVYKVLLSHDIQV